MPPGRNDASDSRVTTFVDEVAATGILHSEYRGIRFTVVPVDPALAVDADPQLLTSAVMNLLHNAFKNTPAGGTVMLSAHAKDSACWWTFRTNAEAFRRAREMCSRPSASGAATDRSGLGLGLSIARQAVRAHGGDILIRNMPGQCCVFTIDVPLAAGGMSVPQFD